MALDHTWGVHFPPDATGWRRSPGHEVGGGAGSDVTTWEKGNPQPDFAVGLCTCTGAGAVHCSKRSLGFIGETFWAVSLAPSRYRVNIGSHGRRGSAQVDVRGETRLTVVVSPLGWWVGDGAVS